METARVLVAWLRNQLFGVDRLDLSFALNIVLWTACAGLVGEIVRRLAGSYRAALLAAVVVLVDMRAVTSMLVLERANLIACLCGLAALLLVVDARDRPLTIGERIGLTALLLGSALGKEFGLAFSGALIAFALLERRRDLAASAFAAAAAYATMRLVLVNGAIARYCAEEGFFFDLRTLCGDWSQPRMWQQAAYNVAITGVNAVVPGLISNFGRIGVDPRWTLASLVLLAVTCVGWWKGPRVARLALLVVVADAALNCLLYRPRNQLVAVCALGVPFGVGIASVQSMLRDRRWGRLLRAAAVAAVLGVIAWQAHMTHDVVVAEIADAAREDPCSALTDDRPLDPAFVSRIKTSFDLPNPDCLFTH